ncbi:Pectinesterase [Macleaya cordata]|uniref:Pectinesterase n=1 Tax=Macleaya cordata TaxID=56857 RepID=A0A200QSL6_MACCD|nr:Pectinesterase [Macleaya cordata]
MSSAANDINARKKRVATVTVSSLVLVAMVVAVAVGVRHGGKGSDGGSGGKDDGEVHTSNKAIQAICQPTDYQQACVESLSKAAGNTSDPKELIRIGFNVTMAHVRESLSHSVTLLQLEKEPRAKLALQNCQELMDYAIDDLQNSFEQLGELDITKIDDAVEDLKVWLSAALTYEETCLDGFENSTSKAGESMKEALKTTQELTQNGLNMVAQIGTILSSLQIPIFNRRLLSAEEEEELEPESADEFPDWATAGQRRLLAAKPANVKPNVVVAKDGSGKYKTVKEAFQDVPPKNNAPFVIYVKAGVYNEWINVTKDMTNVVLIGDGPTKTKITNNKGVTDGINTFASSTFSVVGNGFMAKDIGFENSAGPQKHQAVALRVSADMSIFYNVQIDGYQDTLYAHAKRQFYRDCTISGTVDFIFGTGMALFQNCKIIVRKPMDNQQNMVLASGRKTKDDPSAIVLQDCIISAEPALFPLRKTIKSYLGRPWKEYARHIIMNSQIDDVIDPQGWHEWMGTWGVNTCFFVEFNNNGTGADTKQRVKWRGIKTNLTPQNLQQFTATSRIMKGGLFIKTSGVPFTAGM